MKRKDFLKHNRGLSVAEVTVEEKSLREELMRLRFRKAAGQLTQPSRIKAVKRDVARLATIRTAGVRAESAGKLTKGNATA